MTFTYQNTTYIVEIIKKNNKNTYIRIKNGKIYITTSYFTTKRSIIKLLDNNRKSIEKMLDKSIKKEEKKKDFYLYGEIYLIKEGYPLFKIDENNKIIYIKKKDLLDKYLKIEAKRIYETHLNYWYNTFDKIDKPSLRIRKMTSRWGVCNTKTHVITLNLELMHYKLECLDYVIVHELSHLKEPNHSRAFWNIVEKYYPNYKEIRKILKEE